LIQILTMHINLFQFHSNLIFGNIMKDYRIALSSILLAGLVGLSAQGVYDPDAVSDKNSNLNIPVYEQLYKVRVWRDMDLQEKQNKGFFAKGNEISRIIIDGIKSGAIAQVYSSDSLSEKTVLTKEKFLQNYQRRGAGSAQNWDINATYNSPDRVLYNGLAYEALGANTGSQPDISTNDWVVTTANDAVNFLPSEIRKLEIVEDIIFDKRRSRLYYDIIAIKMMAWDEDGGFFKSLGYIRYRDLEKLFRDNPEKAVWFNRENTAQNRNLADAFMLRLFHASISKLENPDNLELSAILPTWKEGVMAREWEEMKLMEKEHNLWEY
jgi:gliding motility associated protien GldN